MAPSTRRIVWHAYYIHQAVAARLGLDLSFVNFPGHVLLRVVDNPAADANTEYLDPAANGRRLSSAAVRCARSKYVVVRSESP